MYKKRETKKQEYRIVFIKEKEVKVFSLTFVLKNFLDQLKNILAQ